MLLRKKVHDTGNPMIEGPPEPSPSSSCPQTLGPYIMLPKVAFSLKQILRSRPKVHSPGQSLQMSPFVFHTGHNHWVLAQRKEFVVREFVTVPIQVVPLSPGQRISAMMIEQTVTVNVLLYGSPGETLFCHHVWSIRTHQQLGCTNQRLESWWK